MGNLVNIFKGIGKAPLSFGGNYVLPGMHTFKIKECKLITSQQKAADMFIAEMEVIESSNDAMIPGSTRSWVCNFQHASALSNVKSFLVAALNCTPEDLDEEIASGVVNQPDCLAGITIACEANNVKTRKGGDFTKCLWEFVAAQEDA